MFVCFCYPMACSSSPSTQSCGRFLGVSYCWWVGTLGDYELYHIQNLRVGLV